MQDKSKTAMIPMILILLCIVTATGITGWQHETAHQMTIDDGAALREVIAALEDDGYAVTLQTAEPFFLQGDRYQLILNEDEDTLVTVYVYKNEDAAQKDSLSVDPDGFGVESPGAIGIFGTVKSLQVSWVDAPHFFLYKDVIVQYIGSDAKILHTLRQLCGDQFAGISLRCGIDL